MLHAGPPYKLRGLADGNAVRESINPFHWRGASDCISHWSTVLIPIVPTSSAVFGREKSKTTILD